MVEGGSEGACDVHVDFAMARWVRILGVLSDLVV